MEGDFDDFTESEFDAEFGDYDGPVYLLGVRADQSREGIDNNE
jgi:hypothetical protein